MSNVPVAGFTEPAPRNSSALKKACVNRWKIAATSPPTPSPIIMYPSWLMVEYAITRLMSVATIPSSDEMIAVIAPIVATVTIASSEAANTGKKRATRKKPAAPRTTPVAPPPPRRAPLEPEPDQQVRAQPHHLPEHEQLQDARRQHQPQHRRREQRHER